jgi:AGZA family xanthine/uracil permease-like MFS transporter
MELLGGGAVLAGLVLGALAAFIIDRRLKEAGLWAFAGAVLAFFGFIHGSQLGWAVSPQVALGYALFGAVCLAAAMQSQKNPV